MPITETHNVTTLPKPQRLSDYAVGIFESISTRKGIKKALSKGWISVNQKTSNSGLFVTLGDTITITIPDDHRPVYARKIEVLYQDHSLAVVYKPAELLTNGNTFRTLENALPHNLKPNTTLDAIWPEPVHRLDFATSGLVICAKNRASRTTLRLAFEQKKVQKTYHAVVSGHIADSGIINTPIHDKTALTTYKCVLTQQDGKRTPLSLVSLQLETGRTHQLRIHLSSIGYPIIGDSKYGEANTVIKHGLFLTASALQFTHPQTGKLMHFERKLPKKFRRLFEQM